MSKLRTRRRRQRPRVDAIKIKHDPRETCQTPLDADTRRLLKLALGVDRGASTKTKIICNMKDFLRAAVPNCERGTLPLRRPC
jgi:hypothetical protein